ncbi:MAG: apolipoprotein N-acyltransferase [Actinomycetes bacterium]
MSPPFARPALAAGGGLLLAAAFPPVGLWPLAVPAVAVLSLAVHGQQARRGALLGLAYGVAFFLPLLEWMRVIGTDAWVGLSLLEGGFVAVLGAGLAVTSRLRAWPLAGAALWVAAELARAHLPFGGFPWGRLAFAQTASPLTPYAALGGAPLVTAATALAGTLLAAALLALYARHARPAVVALAALVALPALATLVPTPTDADRTVRAAVVQGDVPRSGLDFLGQRQAVLDNHVEVTERYARRLDAGDLPRPDLVVWPENSSDIDPYTDPGAYDLIDGAVSAVGVPTLVGAVVSGPDRDLAYNTGIVWTPGQGPGRTYVKRHPVPFGEYIPFRDVLADQIDRLARIPRDFAAGERPGVLRVGPATVGDVICFEVAYDGLLRDVVAGGADVIVVQTNNATYGRTGQPAQQLAMSRLRAVEHGRAVLVAATSGISAVIAPDGEVVRRSREFVPAVLTAAVPLRDGRTVADRVGTAPEWAMAALGLGALLVAVRARRRETAASSNVDRSAHGAAGGRGAGV